MLNCTQAKANLWKIHATGQVRNPTSLCSQAVSVGSSVPSGLSVMSRHGGRSPAGASWDRLGVRASFRRFLDADGQQKKLTETRLLCRCSGKWVILPSLAMRLKLILVYSWRRTEEVLTLWEHAKDKAIPSPHPFAANTVLWVKEKNKPQHVCSFRELSNTSHLDLTDIVNTPSIFLFIC